MLNLRFRGAEGVLYAPVAVDRPAEDQEGLQGHPVEFAHGSPPKVFPVRQAQTLKYEKDISGEAEELIAGVKTRLIARVMNRTALLVEKDAGPCVASGPHEGLIEGSFREVREKAFVEPAVAPFSERR